jgi:hypothetical protein
MSAFLKYLLYTELCFTTSFYINSKKLLIVPPSINAHTYRKMATKLDSNVQRYLANYYGSSHLQKILESLGKPPCWTTLRVNTLKISPNQAIELINDHFRQNVPGELGKMLISGTCIHEVIPDCIKIPCIGPMNVQDGFPGTV